MKSYKTEIWNISYLTPNILLGPIWQHGGHIAFLWLRSGPCRSPLPLVNGNFWSGIFLLTNREKLPVFWGIPWGKVGGMKCQAKGLPPRGVAGLQPVIPSRQLSWGTSWGKPIPSRHCLLRKTFYIVLEWYLFYMSTLLRLGS